jgi:hypothetical protein
MRKLVIAIFTVLCAAPLMAETYSWEDETGTVNFTENYSTIPAKYRNKMEKRGDMGGAPLQSTANPAPAVKEAGTVPAEKGASTEGSFGGKSYEQWKQDLEGRQAAIKAMKIRIDEMEIALTKAWADKNLLVERNTAVEQYTDMIKLYIKKVELARKAGIAIEGT